MDDLSTAYFFPKLFEAGRALVGLFDLSEY